MDGIDLFKEYIIDRDGRFLHYDEQKRGFITYSFPKQNPDQVFVDDMFVLDSKRNLKVLLTMVRFVENHARQMGKKQFVGAVNIKKPDADRILMAHMWHKMKPFMTSGDFIYTTKEL